MWGVKNDSSTRDTNFPKVSFVLFFTVIRRFIQHEIFRSFRPFDPIRLSTVHQFIHIWRKNEYYEEYIGSAGELEKSTRCDMPLEQPCSISSCTQFFNWRFFFHIIFFLSWMKIGAAVGDELGYLFFTPEVFGSTNNTDREVMNLICSLWTNFAKTGWGMLRNIIGKHGFPSLHLSISRQPVETWRPHTLKSPAYLTITKLLTMTEGSGVQENRLPFWDKWSAYALRWILSKIPFGTVPLQQTLANPVCIMYMIVTLLESSLCTECFNYSTYI